MRSLANGWPGRAPAKSCSPARRPIFASPRTVKGALAEGLAVTVVSDAHSTLDTPGETAVEIIARHNADFTEAGATLVTTKALTGS